MKQYDTFKDYWDGELHAMFKDRQFPLEEVMLACNASWLAGRTAEIRFLKKEQEETIKKDRETYRLPTKAP